MALIKTMNKIIERKLNEWLEPRALSEPKSYTDLEYAVMYKSRCEKLEAELAEALGEIRGLRQLVNDCHIVAGQLETERNEARAEIEQLRARNAILEPEKKG